MLGLFGFGSSTMLLLYPLAGVQSSQIQGNVPRQFDTVLKRDLMIYFRDLNQEVVRVEYELLRDIPTQVGVALPKYYIWVKIYGEKGMIDQGAVKVAAIEKTHFTVLNYLAIADLKKSPERINQVFPVALGDKIRAKLK